MIKNRFREKLKFIKSSRISSSKVSESVISANNGLISDCITAATQETQQSVALGNIVKAVSSEIQTRISKSNSTDHEEDIKRRSKNLYNLIA